MVLARFTGFSEYYQNKQTQRTSVLLSTLLLYVSLSRISIRLYFKHGA